MSLLASDFRLPGSDISGKAQRLTSAGENQVPGQINLSQTMELHRRIEQRWQAAPEVCLQAVEYGRSELSAQGAKFEGARDMELTLSALCFPQSSADALRDASEALHAIVEQAIDWLFADTTRRDRWFGEHRRMFPWLQKSRGQATWQAVSRYDAVVTADGSVKVIELNTGCPAGFMHAQSFSAITEHALANCGLPFDGAANPSLHSFGSIHSGALIREVLAIEAASGIEPGLIALVNDENRLVNELALIAAAFQKVGRHAEIVNAAEITCEDGRAMWKSQVISLAYNKIRISTPHSPSDHWAPGFEDRYAGYLQAISTGAMVVVNNLASLTIAEDKGLLQILREPEFATTLSEAERNIIDQHVLETARLVPGSTRWRGEMIDLLPFVRANRDSLVIKPANEGRGFGVVVGRFATDEEWAAACEPDPALPCVVQEYVEPARMPIVRTTADENANPRHEAQPHFLTLGLALLNGKYQGVLSRVSANPITNVGRTGIVQAVFVTE